MDWILGIIALYLVSSSREHMTLPAVASTTPSTTASTPSPASGETPDSLRQRYTRLQSEYETLLTQKAPVETLRTKNREMEEVVQQMITMRQESQVSRTDVEELVGILNRIQKDYNGLSAHSDQYETLRRIREEQSADTTKQIQVYFSLFLATCLLFVVLFVFQSMRGAVETITPSFYEAPPQYTNDITPMTPNTDTAIPPFTQRDW